MDLLTLTEITLFNFVVDVPVGDLVGGITRPRNTETAKQISF